MMACSEPGNGRGFSQEGVKVTTLAQLPLPSQAESWNTVETAWDVLVAF